MKERNIDIILTRVLVKLDGSSAFLRLYKILCSASWTLSPSCLRSPTLFQSTTLVQKVACSASASKNYLRNLQPLFFPSSADSLLSKRSFPTSRIKLENEFYGINLYIVTRHRTRNKFSIPPANLN